MARLLVLGLFKLNSSLLICSVYPILNLKSSPISFLQISSLFSTQFSSSYINQRLLTVFFFGVIVSLQVQNLIERCLQLYMSQKEVVETLLAQAKIEPGFTELGRFFSLPLEWCFLFSFMFYSIFTW